MKEKKKIFWGEENVEIQKKQVWKKEKKCNRLMNYIDFRLNVLFFFFSVYNFFVILMRNDCLCFDIVSEEFSKRIEWFFMNDLILR